MSKFRMAAVCALSLLLAACASAGSASIKNETEESVKAKIIEGTTTKEQVRALFGAPYDKDIADDGKEVWQYDYANANMFAQSKRKTLMVVFNNNVVYRYVMNDTSY